MWKLAARQLALLQLLCIAALVTVEARSSLDGHVREHGRCSMYDSCGRKSIFAGELPCPDNERARSVDDDPILAASLVEVCGADFLGSDRLACCTADQVMTLSQSLAQAEPLISSCPACRANFRHWFCSFTCSPDQSLFMEVTRTQEVSKDGKPSTAVKEVVVDVASDFGRGFYDSCKDVKFGATNGYAMDLIGGGAKNWLAFLQYTGQERSLGSPFQITYRNEPDDMTVEPFDDNAKGCSDGSLDYRCACLDCPDVCASLPKAPAPPITSPDDPGRCRVGKISCYSFTLTIVYSALLVLTLGGASMLELVRSSPSSRMGNGGGYSHLPQDDPASRQTVIDDSSHGSTSPLHKALGRFGLMASRLTGSRGGAPQGELHRSTRSADTSVSTTHRVTFADSPMDVGFVQPRKHAVNVALSRGFYSLGRWCASKPYLTIAVSLAICGLVNIGWRNFEVEKDPVNLWVAKGSVSERAKREFDDAFGPFYRTEQLFLSSRSNEPVLNWERVQWWAQVEDSIRSLRSSPNNYTLSDVCLSPSTDSEPPRDSQSCVVQTFMGYFGGSLQGVNEGNWATKLDSCASSPALCLPGSQMPLNPRLLFGEVPQTSGDEVAASQARAFVITFVIKNSLDPKVVAVAEEWEAALKDTLASLSLEGVDIAFSTEISLEQELNKSTNTDVGIVVLSYLVMFLYIAVNLGASGTAVVAMLVSGVKAVGRGVMRGVSYVLPRHFPPESYGRAPEGLFATPSLDIKRALLVDSKVTLGLWGIFIVLLSVSTSVAIFSTVGVKVTLIIAEVIPFLVLAIGVDNVFLLSHELERQNARAYASVPRLGGSGIAEDDDAAEDIDYVLSVDERIARMLARMGPSIVLSAACETVAFALGAVVGMPAVRNFAIYAAGAVVVNALLQITVFVSAMAIDLRRVESNRLDCMPFLKLPASSMRTSSGDGFLAHIMREYYAPALMWWPVKWAVFTLFSALFLLSWISSAHVQLGLDQRLALPQDSYLVNYFNALDRYLDVGPPVYFVATGVDPRHRADQQHLCGRFTTCDELSLANVLEAERKRPETSFLAEPPAVWVDDFFQWLNPLLEDCCRVKRNDPKTFCGPHDSEMACKPCYEDREPGWNITMEGLPREDEFMPFLQHWLEMPTDENCPLAGKAGYSNALKIGSSGTVELSQFRTFHTPLKTQADFINALAAARRISADISRRTGARVFPYSIFYVFFEQYAHIVSTSYLVIALALAAVFILASFLLGSWRTGAVVVFTVFLSVFNVVGMMGAWHIDLNAISLVNLVIAIGIAVEFCAHVARSFMGANNGGLPFKHLSGKRDRDQRVISALADVGASVLSGITFTKLIGICVLAFTHSKLLEIYYFRQWLSLIVAGALHGLIFLPVALSYQGGRGYSFDEDDALDVQGRYDSAVQSFGGDEDDDDESAEMESSYQD